MEWIVLILLVYIPLMFGVYHLAKRYGKNADGWTIGSLFISPIVCIIILWCLGETRESWEERIISEELLRKKIRDGIDCPNCHSPNDRDAQFCIKCGVKVK